MRDLDTRSILINDFIVLYGDVVSNLNLDAAMARHRARRQADKNAIMTMILREAGASHRSKAQDLSPVFVIDPLKERCLHYEQLVPGSKRDHAELDSDMLSQDVEVRTDLIDCGIDICTPDVLALWSDNFDYEAPRKGFLHSVLKDYELNGKTIHAQITHNGYAARVRDFRAYDSVSRDVLRQWSYPLCPDSNFYQDSLYPLPKKGLRQGHGSRLARSVNIGPDVVVGKGTSIDESCKVAHSTIGCNCSLGKNCTVENAYVWDRVNVGDGCELRNCVIGCDTTVGARSKVVEGALVSYGIGLPEGTSLGRGSRAHRKRSKGTDVCDANNNGDYELIREADGERIPDKDLSSSKRTI